MSWFNDGGDGMFQMHDATCEHMEGALTEGSGFSVIRRPEFARFIVVEPLPLIATDIVEAIRGSAGECDVQVFPLPDIAHHAMAEMSDVTAAFLSMRKQAILDSCLHRSVKDRGGQVIIVSGSLAEEEALSEGWLLLREPFTGDMVDNLLARLSGQVN